MTAHWGQFERKQRAATPGPSPERESFEDICARSLTTADGRELLRFLYEQYVDRRDRPGASEAELRESEAKRRMVFELEVARDAGLERAKNRNKT